jgi:DNA-binding transcriptional ArsR family regulator
MSRKVNKYFVTIPVDDWQRAKLLGNETNWRILQELRDVGIEGLSAEEISEKIRVPKSSVYSILSKLAAAQLIESTMRRSSWGRPSKESEQRFGGKPTRVFIENVPWGLSAFDADFIDSLDPILKGLKKDLDDLRRRWLSVLEKTVAAYQTNELKKFFPQDAIHEECGHSHEGSEFLDAINHMLLYEILEGKDFEELARRYKFMK